MQSQKDGLHNRKNELNTMGDINLEYLKWGSADYALKPLVDLVKVLQGGISMIQMVESHTRMALVNEQLQKSLIGHCYQSVQGNFTHP